MATDSHKVGQQITDIKPIFGQMSAQAFELAVPIKRAYDVIVSANGSTFINQRMPIQVNNLAYTNNNQQIQQASDFQPMVALLDQPGATGQYTVTVGVLPSFLKLNATTGLIEYDTGSGDVNFEFTVTFTANGAYTGTVSFVVRAGNTQKIFTNVASEVIIIQGSLTTQQILDSKDTPILVWENPNPEFIVELLGYNERYRFGGIPFAPDTGGSFISWGLFLNPGTDRYQRNIGSLLDNNNGYFTSLEFDENYQVTTSIPVGQPKGASLFIGTNPEAIGVFGPVGGNGSFEYRYGFTVYDGTGLPDVP